MGGGGGGSGLMTIQKFNNHSISSINTHQLSDSRLFKNNYRRSVFYVLFSCDK